MSRTPLSAYERLRAAAAGVAVPEAVRAAVAAVPGDPGPGQIWRVAWDGLVDLVAVTAVDDATVYALPVSLETRYHDADTLLLPPAASTLEQPLALWRGLGRRLPWCVLDRQVSRLSVPLASDGSPTPAAASGYRHGTPVPSPAARAAGVRAALADTMDRLAAAHWAPGGSGNLTSLLQEHGIGRAQLMERLGITPSHALALLRAQAPLTPHEADLLAPLLRIAPDEVLAGNPPVPDGLVQELSRPARRAQIRQLARRTGTTERDARHEALFATLGLAARQDNPAEVDWRSRVDRYFDVHLSEGTEQ